MQPLLSDGTAEGKCVAAEPAHIFSLPFSISGGAEIAQRHKECAASEAKRSAAAAILLT